MDIGNRIAASSITFRDEGLDSALQRLQHLGFSRLDLVGILNYCNHFDPLLVDVGEKECIRVRDIVNAHGMQAVSVTSYPANPLAHDLNGDDWTAGVDAYVRLGMHLNAHIIVLPPGNPAPREDRWQAVATEALPWQREAIRRVLTAHMRPAIALQSNSLLRTTRQANQFLGLLHMINVGIAVDPAHLAAMGEDPVEAIRNLSGVITFMVLRDTDGTNFNLPPGEGILDYAGILRVLDDIGYTGPLALAIDNTKLSAQQREDYLKRGWENLDRLTQRKAA